MHLVVTPSFLQGTTLSVPGDKSISHRAVMLGALADGVCRISNFLDGEDCLATVAAMRAMGVRIDAPEPTTVEVHGVGLHGLRAPGGPIDLGNSGTAMRLFAGLLAGQAFDCVLTGDRSLSRRPMGRVIEPLRRMGAEIDSREGRPPLAIHGRRQLSRIRYSLPVASAQVKSAVLLASLYAGGVCEISEPAVTRDHTERMLLAMGVPVENANGRVLLTVPAEPRATSIEVPGDLSSAAFMMLAALLAEDCELLIENVGVNATRTGVIDILTQMGAAIRLEKRRQAGREAVADIRVVSSKLHGVDVDPSLVSLAIDEFPVLFIAAAAARGPTRFRGLAELRVKESDRIGAMVAGLKQLGIEVDETSDGALVRGGTMGGGNIQSFDDHRIAMAFAVAGTIATEAVTIRDTDSINTSFPGFAACLRQMGASIEEEGCLK